MLSICTELFSDRRQRGVVDCAASEWIPIISGVPQGRVLGSLLCILYTSEMFDLVENRLFAYADDYTLLAVVRKPADRPAVIAFFKRDFFRIQERYNQCCLVQNPNKSEALVISRSRTVTPPQGDLILSGASIRASPNLDILDVKFYSKLTFEDHVHGIVSTVSQRIGILKLVLRIYLDTSVSLRCYFAFVLRCEGLQLNVTFSSLSARFIRRPGFVSIRVSCRCVIDVVWLGLVYCARLIRSLITVLRPSICFY